jgi:hypothetical protein
MGDQTVSADADEFLSERIGALATRSLSISRSGSNPRQSDARPASPFASWFRTKSEPFKEKSLRISFALALRPENRTSRSESIVADGHSVGGAESNPTIWGAHFSRSGELLRNPFEDINGTPVAEPPILDPQDEHSTPRQSGMGQKQVTKLSGSIIQQKSTHGPDSWS